MLWHRIGIVTDIVIGGLASGGSAARHLLPPFLPRENSPCAKHAKFQSNPAFFLQPLHMAVARMLLLLLLLPCSRAELVQVHLLTHHGAHGLPYATPTLSDLDRIPSAADLRWPWPGVYSSPNNQGPPLTTFGQAQLYSVGQHLRNRFMDSCTSGGVFCLLSGVDPPSAETVYIRATDLDRTLESAEALQRSLFPADPHRSPRPLHLPVHTVPQV